MSHILLDQTFFVIWEEVLIVWENVFNKECKCSIGNTIKDVLNLDNKRQGFLGKDS